MLSPKVARSIFKFHGWSLVGKPIPEEVQRCVFVFAPHTSNWDFYHGLMCMRGWNVPVKVAIKKYWMRWPFRWIIKPMGGIGIDRNETKDGKRLNQVDLLASVFKQYQRIALIITPEGSRSARNEWKTGFYHIARKAGVPIVTLTGNFDQRTIEFGPVFTGEEQLDDIMRKMMEFFKKGVGKYPQNFAVDHRYA